ncbi:TVP38/TMEM64 family inner membrane protein YdjZ [Clostridioides difficile]|nr:TVP38/TMEM64 family inner membrane protein YdjZ [Clostridioides difficile]
MGVLAIYFFIPPVKKMVNQMIFYLSMLNLDAIKEYILSFGVWAPIISFALMILQSIAAPLPAFLITFANAALFGWVNGAILSWVSAMAGAAICFVIGRFLGRDVVAKLTSKFALESIDGFFDKYGKHTILIARLLPFISFDLVSYAAGLTSMSFISFFIATGVGQLPATIVYSYVGGMLTGGAKVMMTGLLILFALSVLIYMLKKIYSDKNK